MYIPCYTHSLKVKLKTEGGWKKMEWWKKYLTLNDLSFVNLALKSNNLFRMWRDKNRALSLYLNQQLLNFS